jgi:hypothetical protein
MAPQALKIVMARPPGPRKARPEDMLDRATQQRRVCASMTLPARRRARTGWPAFAGHDKLGCDDRMVT